MKSLLRKCLLLAWLGGLVFGLMSVNKHWEYDLKAPDVEAMLANRVNTESLTASLSAAIASENYDEARSLMAIGQKYHHDIDYAAYQKILSEKDTLISRMTKQVSDFADGFASGKSETTSGVAGALTSDFTVVGDVRDLNEQYSRYQQGLPVNELVATLAGVGVGLTAATVGSFGLAAPAKAGASTLKLATKMNRLTKGFRSELMTIGSRVFNWKAFASRAKDTNLVNLSRLAKQSYNPVAARQLGVIAEQANTIRKSTSIADSVHLFKYIDNTQDLSRVNRLTQKYGIHTHGVFLLLGKAAVRGVKTLRMTLELIFSLLGSFLSGICFLFSLSRQSAA